MTKKNGAIDPLLVIDLTCPSPYDSNSLKTQTLGGTEATVIRVMEKLSEKIPVIVVQHNRTETFQQGNITYSRPLFHLMSLRWRAIVVLRHPQYAINLRARFKDVPIWVWMHDLLGLEQLHVLQGMVENDIGYLTVSDFHSNQLFDLQNVDSYIPKMPKIQRIYNPIADDLVPDETVIDKNKLVFVSAPLKGLQHTLRAFEIIRKRYPQFELFISNPGYGYLHNSLEDLQIAHVRYLGPLTHADNIKMVRSALAVFSLNYVAPETFGIAFAEANAVGTPVLAHPFGALPEVVSNPSEQLVNVHDLFAVMERLMHWHQGGRPSVHGKALFKVSSVCKEWEKLLSID